VLKDFAKTHDVFVIKGGLLGIEFLSPERIAELADIEPRDVLLAQIAGAMKAPMANFAGLLAALPRNAASVFAQLLEQKEAEEQPTADSAEEADVADEAVEAEADGGEPTAESAEEADAADEASVTEDKIEVAADASEDAGKETEDQTDEASDDAEEE